MHDRLVRGVRRNFWLLLGAVGFVLMIACANLANLQLARGVVRKRDSAIRTALGSSRRQLARHLLADSLVLALLGGILGLLLTCWGVRLLKSLAEQRIPLFDRVGIDIPVLVFTLVILLVAGIVCGLLPQLMARRTDVSELLREGARGITPGFRVGRFRQLLIVCQVALAIVLLIGAGLMTRSLLSVWDVDLGFDPEGVLTAQISLPEGKYVGTRRWDFFNAVLDRVRALPGVLSAGAGPSLLEDGASGPVVITGSTVLPSGRPPRISYTSVTPGYFRAMGIPLLRGRTFELADTDEAREVIVVNQTMARRFWPDDDPIGKRINDFVEEGADGLTIIGVVADVRRYRPTQEVVSQYYRPSSQLPWSTMTLVVRAGGEPMNLASSLRRAVRDVDNDQPIYNVRTMSRILSESVALRRLTMLVLTAFSFLALGLALVGIYGVLSYAVSQRTHELGIRIALGAPDREILSSILKYGLGLTLIGVGVGLAASFALTRVMSSVLFGVSPTDPATFVGATLLLILVSFVGCYIPARRAHQGRSHGGAAARDCLSAVLKVHPRGETGLKTVWESDDSPRCQLCPETW